MESKRSGKPWELICEAIVRRLPTSDSASVRRNFAYFGTKYVIFLPNTLICAKNWEIMAHELSHYIWWSVDCFTALCGSSPSKTYDFSIKLKQSWG